MRSGQWGREWRRRGIERVDGTGSIVAVSAALIRPAAKTVLVEHAGAIATGRENALAVFGWFISIVLAKECTIGFGVVTAIRLDACGIEG